MPCSSVSASLRCETGEFRHPAQQWARKNGSAGLPPRARSEYVQALNAPGRAEGFRKIAQRFGRSVPTMQRISRHFEHASARAYEVAPNIGFVGRRDNCEPDAVYGHIFSVRDGTPVRRLGVDVRRLGDPHSPQRLALMASLLSLGTCMLPRARRAVARSP
jgi:hypothetical protein